MCPELKASPQILRCWENKEPTEDAWMYFSTLPQDDADTLSDIQLQNDSVAGGVAWVWSFEFPCAHLVMAVLHQDGSRSVGAVAKSHEWKVVHPFPWSSEDACKRGK